METLYDLLGALPNDDAEGLRAAFRRAVKGAHPDIRPGDPEAALKFRGIVRANEILGDVELRAAYDELLELARLRTGMKAAVEVDGYPDKAYTGTIDSMSAGTGARFSLLPPENATGNWVKVVQRVPVRIHLDGKGIGNPHTLRAGMSVVVTIRVR